MQKQKAWGQQGFSLTELAIVLGVMGLVLGATWSVVSNVQRQGQVRQAQQQLMTVVQNVREYYGANAVGNNVTSWVSLGDLTNDANSKHLLPQDMRRAPTDTTNTVYHAMSASLPASGTFRLTAGGATEPLLRVMLLNIKREQCSNFVMSYPFLTKKMGITRVCCGTSGGGAMTESYCADINLANISSPSTPAIIPFTSMTAGACCSQTSSGNIALSITYRLRN